MAIQDEYKLDRFGSIRPPRGVMAGGLARAAAAGEQATNSAIAGGATSAQASSVMSPAMRSLVASFGAEQANQNFAQSVSEIRRMNAIDQMNDAKSYENAAYKEANRVDAVDIISTAGKVATVAAAVAGKIADSGTKTVSKDVPMTDADGKPMLDISGKPIVTPTKSIELSPAAKAARKVQDAIGAVIPSIGRSAKAHREEVLSRIEVSNKTNEVDANQRAAAAAQAQYQREAILKQEALVGIITSHREFLAEDEERVGEMGAIAKRVNDHVLMGASERYESDPQFMGPPTPVRSTWAPPSSGISPQSIQLVSAYDDTFTVQAQRNGIDPLLLKAQAIVESGGRPTAVSSAGAKGLMQFMPATARGYGLSDPFNPQESIRAASDYMSDLIDRFDGNMDHVAAGYNAGETNMARWIEKYGGVPQAQESVDYIEKIKWHYKQLGGTKYWSD